jgi:hypothetical protein
MDKPRYCPPFTPMAAIHEPGRAGDWVLEHYEIDEASARFWASARPREYSHLQAGIYAKLKRGETIVMTDTPFERLSNYEAVHQAQGRVLIGGLGLGMVLLPILRKPTVERVYVLEQDPAVIELVAPGLQRAVPQDYEEKLQLLCGDVKVSGSASVVAGLVFDTIYLDIWDEISGDNWPEYKALKLLWRKSLAVGGWLGCWKNDNVKERSR